MAKNECRDGHDDERDVDVVERVPRMMQMYHPRFIRSRAIH